MMTSKPMMTDAGKALLLRALAGEELTFTRMALGSGQLPTGQDGSTLSALIQEEVSVPLTGMDRSQEGLLTIAGSFSNGSLARDFVWRELGVFARTENQAELLYAYANDGGEAGTLKKLTSDLLIEQTLTLVIEVDEAENVTAFFNPHEGYAPAQTLTGHMNNQNNPHNVTKEQIGLGSVVNKSPENMTVSFGEAETVGTINSGEKMSVMLGKIRKAMMSYVNHLADSQNPHHVMIDNIAQVGVYTGDGTIGRIITAEGARAVYVCDEYGRTFSETDGVCGGLALHAAFDPGTNHGVRAVGSPASAANTWNDDYTALMIVNGGFKVNYAAGSIATNAYGVLYHYVAFY